MEDGFKILERIFGSPEEVAEKLGYTERRYRDFKNGVAPIPKAVKLAIERLIMDHLHTDPIK